MSQANIRRARPNARLGVACVPATHHHACRDRRPRAGAARAAADVGEQVAILDVVEDAALGGELGGIENAAGHGLAAVVDPHRPLDHEAVAAQHGRHFGVAVLVLVVGIDERLLLQPRQVGVGGVEGQDPTRLEDAPGFRQYLLGLRARDVLDALPAVDHVERRRRVAAQVGHGVVAVGDPPSGDVDRAQALVVLVQLVAVLARQVDDHDLLELVRVAHQDERAVGDAEGHAADVEDPPCPRQAADEDTASVVQGRAELGHGRRVAPLGRVDQPLHELARARRATFQLRHERVVGGGLPAEQEVEQPPV